MTDMDPDVRARLFTAAHRRAKFLEECLRPDSAARNFPTTQLMERAATNLLRTLIVVIGEELAREWMRCTLDDLADVNGLCRFCRKHAPVPDRGMCRACWDECDEVERDVARDLVMDRPTKGQH